MKVVMIISAIAEWKAVKETYPRMELLQFPYGETPCITLDRWDLTLYHSGWGKIASADSDIPPDKISFLESLGAIAGDWESGALAWVAQKNRVCLLILRGVSDLVNEREGETYENLQLFEEGTKGIMRKLFEQLPDWLNAVKK